LFLYFLEKPVIQNKQYINSIRLKR